MRRKLIRTIIILPGTALVYVPLLIMWVTRHSVYAATWPDYTLISFWFSLILLCTGLALAFWTARLFFTYGDDYLQYKAHVPRWFPRMMSWTPPPEND